MTTRTSQHILWFLPFIAGILIGGIFRENLVAWVFLQNGGIPAEVKDWWMIKHLSADFRLTLGLSGGALLAASASWWLAAGLGKFEYWEDSPCPPILRYLAFFLLGTGASALAYLSLTRMTVSPVILVSASLIGLVFMTGYHMAVMKKKLAANRLKLDARLEMAGGKGQWE